MSARRRRAQQSKCSLITANKYTDKNARGFDEAQRRRVDSHRIYFFPQINSYIIYVFAIKFINLRVNRVLFCTEIFRK